MPIANTPGQGQPISLQDIYNVFGKGIEPTSPGYELDNYNGVVYWDANYPYNKGRFANTGSPLQLNDFYSKCARDPVVPGSYIDDTPGSRAFTVPPFRNNFKIELWGGGGGAGAGDHDSVRPSGSSGTASSITGLTAGGGSGGTSGYRYGNQSGTGGAGGVAANTITFNAAITRTNGSAGANGNAGAGTGGKGGDSPNGGTGGNFGAYNTSNYNGRYAGFNGNAPGGGGGSGGSSDFQGGKNANPNRSAGGAGGGGSYASVTYNKTQISVGQRIIYTVGAGGAGSTGNQGPGGSGANGRVKFSWDS